MVYFDKAVLFYNKNAGEADIEQKLARTVPILSQSIKSLTVIHTESEEEFQKKCREIATDVDLVIILGGDGTVHTAINIIAPLEKRPAIAILPGGTSNDFSRTLSTPQKLDQAARSLVNGKLVPIDIGKSNKSYFLNFWGIGLVSDTSKNVDENQKANLGVLSYFMSTLRTIKAAESFSYQIQAEGENREGEAVLIFVLNGRFIGTRRLPIDSLDPQDGKVDVLIVRNSNIASLRELMSLQNPEANVSQFTELDHFRASELEITTGTPKDIDMDGEMYAETPSHIKVLPAYLKFLVPGN